jgi:hypothetical protein
MLRSVIGSYLPTFRDNLPEDCFTRECGTDWAINPYIISYLPTFRDMLRLQGKRSLLIGCPETSVTTTLRYVTSLKSDYLTYYVTYSCFGTTYQSHFQGWSSLLIRVSRNVGNYYSTLRNIPEERLSHLHRGEILILICLGFIHL